MSVCSYSTPKGVLAQQVHKWRYGGKSMPLISERTTDAGARAGTHFRERKTDLDAGKLEPASSFQTLAGAWSFFTCSRDHFYFCRSACWFNCYLKCHWLFTFSGSQYWTPVVRWFMIRLTWPMLHQWTRYMLVINVLVLSIVVFI